MFDELLMKIFPLIILILSFSAFGQGLKMTDQIESDLFKTYGYCKSQEWTLKRISADFPQLNVLQANIEFDEVFGKSCKNVTKILASLKGINVDEFNKLLKEKLTGLVDYSKLTPSTAADFIGKVKARAKGDISSPFKELLLSFNPDFEINPSAEFLSGFTNIYRTENHPKAKGLDFSLKVPTSWKSREGNRPNIIQFFKGKYGNGEAAMTLMVMEIPKEIKETPKEISAMFTQPGLKEFAPSGAIFIEGKPITLEGQKGGMIVYDMREERLDLKLKMRTTAFMVYYKRRILMIQFMVGDLEKEMPTTLKNFNKNKPLFLLVANSLVIIDKYK